MLLSWSRRDKKLTTIVAWDNDENGTHDTAHLAYTLPSQTLDMLRLFRNFSTTCTSSSWYPRRL